MFAILGKLLLDPEDLFLKENKDFLLKLGLRNSGVFFFCKWIYIIIKLRLRSQYAIIFKKKTQTLKYAVKAAFQTHLEKMAFGYLPLSCMFIEIQNRETSPTFTSNLLGI